ncbi:hypothetical protein HID58_088497 [Brassica napus]|uniref:Uncharacterized protein n=1 Tax=Brassica napus TaxID=3708 RepID=A0ABQ7XWC9_BRANA|nr:hypothetical protein HID58_088497 [Brassica napus]
MLFELSSMVNQAAVAAFYLLVLAILSNFQLSASSLVCGKVSCLDCLRDFDFSGIKILLKCDGTCDHHGGLKRIVPSKHESEVLTTSNPLSFSLSCPKPTGDHIGNIIGDSKTIDFPGTGGFGFPPASFFPFLTIIGIP